MIVEEEEEVEVVAVRQWHKKDGDIQYTHPAIYNNWVICVFVDGRPA